MQFDLEGRVSIQDLVGVRDWEGAGKGGENKLGRRVPGRPDLLKFRGCIPVKVYQFFE